MTAFRADVDLVLLIGEILKNSISPQQAFLKTEEAIRTAGSSTLDHTELTNEIKGKMISSFVRYCHSIELGSLVTPDYEEETLTSDLDEEAEDEDDAGGNGIHYLEDDLSKKIETEMAENGERIQWGPVRSQLDDIFEKLIVASINEKTLPFSFLRRKFPSGLTEFIRTAVLLLEDDFSVESYHRQVLQIPKFLTEDANIIFDREAARAWEALEIYCRSVGSIEKRVSLLKFKSGKSIRHKDSIVAELNHGIFLVCFARKLSLYPILLKHGRLVKINTTEFKNSETVHLVNYIGQQVALGEDALSGDSFNNIYGEFDLGQGVKCMRVGLSKIGAPKIEVKQTIRKNKEKRIFSSYRLHQVPFPILWIE